MMYRGMFSTLSRLSRSRKGLYLVRLRVTRLRVRARVRVRVRVKARVEVGVRPWLAYVIAESVLY